MRHLFLHDFHQQQKAEFLVRNNFTIPAHYGSMLDELNAVEDNLVLIDRSYLGKLRISGPDSLDFIHRISTNDLNQLVLKTVCDTIFTSPKGRIIDYCRILREDENYLLVSSQFGTGHIMEWLNRFIIMDDVELCDVSDEYIWLTLAGPECCRFIRSLGLPDVAEKDEQAWIIYEDLSIPALLNQNYKVPAYNLCLPADHAFEVMDWLHQRLMAFGGRLMGHQAFEVLRITSGAPEYGSELSEDYNPHETRLLRAVSFTKGCYTGQEVIARLDAYDKVQKYLMIVEADQPLPDEKPLPVYYGGEVIGRLTSHAFDPRTKTSVGLAFVNREYTIDDLNLTVEIEGRECRIRGGLKVPPVIRPE